MTARAGIEVVSIGYVYKPSRRQMDAVVDVVKELVPRVRGLTVSQFYDFSAERSLREYREDPERYARNLRTYLKQRSKVGLDGAR